MNILLLTSCNRIKQVLLSLSLNAQIIKGEFGVVIVDSSTFGVDAETACKIHDSDDPYNVVKPYNYCSDISLLYDAHNHFKNIVDFKVIHYSPRLNKQNGESTSIGLGLQQASLMGGRPKHQQNYCLKLTGTSILKTDTLTNLSEQLLYHDVLTWHRMNIGGFERSTRIFGCKPNILSKLIADYGWYNWVDDNRCILEQRFAHLLNEHIPNSVNYTNNDESGVLLEGGLAMQQSYGRERITNFIKSENININATPYLQEFMDGGIW